MSLYVFGLLMGAATLCWLATWLHDVLAEIWGGE